MIVHIPYDHYNFSKGLEDWFAKHNRYSTEEARLVSNLEKRPLRECWSRDSMVRKRALKSWFVRMPAMSVKLFELGKLTSGQAAQIAGIPRATFLYTLSSYGIEAVAWDVEEAEQEFLNA